jgi:peptidoglycan/LPS O-acetylase OafA/YrhL
MISTGATALNDKKIRFHYLDGVRGVAAFLVIFYHFRNAFFDKTENSSGFVFLWQQLDLFFLKAEFSVQLFFVLSGFVLAYNSFYRENFLKKQWIKRYYRLVMPVFISSLIYFFLIKSGALGFDALSKIHTNSWIEMHWQMEFTLPQFFIRFFYSFLLFFDWQFIWNINSSLWTIPVELFWSYILFAHFAVMKFIKKKWMKNIFLAGAILFLIRFVEITGENYAVLFLAGALMALNFDFLRQFFSQSYRRYLLLATAIGYTIVVENGWWLAESYSYPFRWGFFAAMIYILLALVSQKIQEIFSLPFVQWLGRISFALYLLHLLVIGTAASWLYVSVPFFRADTGLLLLLLITILLSLGISDLFTRYIDEPLMNLFDIYYKKLTGSKRNTLVTQAAKINDKTGA